MYAWAPHRSLAVQWLVGGTEFWYKAADEGMYDLSWWPAQAGSPDTKQIMAAVDTMKADFTVWEGEVRLAAMRHVSQNPQEAPEAFLQRINDHLEEESDFMWSMRHKFVHLATQPMPTTEPSHARHQVALPIAIERLPRPYTATSASLRARTTTKTSTG